VEIRYAKSAVKLRIRAGIYGLTEKPPQGDIKMMQGYHAGRQGLRIGKYRIVCRYGVEKTLKSCILWIYETVDIYTRNKENGI